MIRNDKTYPHPDCYKPNDNPYPLCVGGKDEGCKQCCLCEYMKEEPYGREKM